MSGQNGEGHPGEDVTPEEQTRPSGTGPDRLWAPWRIAYFTEPQPDECIFCVLPAQGEEADLQARIVARYDRCYVIMNKYPYSNGHLMVVPYDHVPDVPGLDVVTRAELLKVAGDCTIVLGEELQAHGFNIGFNLGTAAGAGIIDHVHLHVVPRWHGDTNYMPVLADTKVLSESLAGTYERLRPAFDKLST
jgi:ATP adenylyltransferase